MNAPNGAMHASPRQAAASRDKEDHQVERRQTQDSAENPDNDLAHGDPLLCDLRAQTAILGFFLKHDTNFN
jgi:hypothetical protein